MSAACYAELQVTSHFSFLRGASSCGELFAQAASLGIAVLAAGGRRPPRPRDLADGVSVLVYPTEYRSV